MADQCVIIEGSVKYRDGRKWKPRWCVMRKLSPVADCVHLLLYRDARARWSAGAGGGGGGGVKATLSLARCVGLEEWAPAGAGAGAGAGEHALALLCRDAVHVLALESRERLLQWQSAAARAMRARSFDVRVVAGTCAGAAAGTGGRARLHVARGCAALASGGVGGTPPRLLLVWEVSALRRFGAAGDRLVLEGGAACGRGAGAHVLLAARAADAAAALRHQAAQALADGGEASRVARPDSLRLAARRGSDTSLEAGGAGGGGLARCRSCMSKLGTTPAPTTLFSPAWSMPPLPRSASAFPPRGAALDNYDVPRLPSVEAEGEYYDTPKRLQECLSEEDEARASPELSRIERRPCGCVVRLRAPAGGGGSGGGGGAMCACRRVTDWAQGWLRCAPSTPTPAASPAAPAPLYATVDLSRKSRRPPRTLGRFADYENLQFPHTAAGAHYENAHDWWERLRRGEEEGEGCTCGDDYLLMEPRAPPAAPAGYTPMSPPGLPVQRRAGSPPPPARSSSVDARQWLEGGGSGGAGEVRRCASVPGCRDSSSSNDSGVSLCSPPPRAPPRPPPARRSRSTEPRGGCGGEGGARATGGKSSSAEAEVPVRPRGAGAGAGGSTSSGASDMSDYIETLSLCSSHSSGEPPPPPRAATTLRPRAGAEYRTRPSPSPAPTPATPVARY